MAYVPQGIQRSKQVVRVPLQMHLAQQHACPCACPLIGLCVRMQVHINVCECVYMALSFGQQQTRSTLLYLDTSDMTADGVLRPKDLEMGFTVNRERERKKDSK